MENKNDMSFMCAADNITYQKAKELYYNLDKYDEAFPTIKNEAENGNPEAQYILAEMYFTHLGLHLTRIRLSSGITVLLVTAGLMQWSN